MNFLTIDFEEWYNVFGTDTSKYEKEKRLKESCLSLLEVLEETNTSATFFFLGKDVKDNKDLVKLISSKYDIGIHGYEHKLLQHLDIHSFKEDTLKAKEILEDVSNKAVTKYRAAGFSLEKTEYFEVLCDCGIKIDSSLSAINHQYGKKTISLDNVQQIHIPNTEKYIKEYPPTIFNIIGFKGFLGGGYFRILPYKFIHNIILSRQNQNKDTLIYIHPRDIDETLPYIKDVSSFRNFKNRVGVSKTKNKLKQILTTFPFTSIE